MKEITLCYLSHQIIQFLVLFSVLYQFFSFLFFSNHTYNYSCQLRNFKTLMPFSSSSFRRSFIIFFRFVLSLFCSILMIFLILSSRRIYGKSNLLRKLQEKRSTAILAIGVKFAGVACLSFLTFIVSRVPFSYSMLLRYKCVVFQVSIIII